MFEGPHRKPGEKHTKRKVVVGFLAAAGIAAGSSALTMALLQDSESLDGSEFGTATLNLALGSGATAFHAPSMLPGQTVYSPVTVMNTGDAELRYAMQSKAALDNQLGNSLNLTVKTGVDSCDATGFASGTQVARTNLFYFQQVFGSTQAGQQAGDRVLAAGETEELCLAVQLDPNYRGSTTSQSTGVDFSYDAEQTADNP